MRIGGERILGFIDSSIEVSQIGFDWAGSGKIGYTMAYTSGSSNSYNSNVGTLCYCMVKARLSTAHTSGNFGRRFLGCAGYKSARGCNFFAWIDEPFEPQANNIIHRLLRQKTDLQEKITKLEESIKEKDVQIAKINHGNRKEIVFAIVFVVVVVAVSRYLV